MLATVIGSSDEVWVFSMVCCVMLTEFSVEELVAVVTPKNKELRATNTQQMLNIKITIDVNFQNCFGFFHINLTSIL